jgi:hypothetical protein
LGFGIWDLGFEIGGFNLKSQATNFKLVEKLRFFGTSDLLRVAIDGKEQYWLRL